MEQSKRDQSAGSTTSPSGRVLFMDQLDSVLETLNQRCCWIWGVFLLTSMPGTFNAWHIMVSTFYARVPPHWCRVAELDNTNWTQTQIRSVINPHYSQEESYCTMVNWNYTYLASLSYDEAMRFINSTTQPAQVPCETFTYNEQYKSTISEWDLVCTSKIGKSNIQGVIGTGKLFGAFLSGIISDRFGRKVSFILASFTYFIFGPLAAFSPTFWSFLALRFLIGVAGAACYATGFTILAELVSKDRRAVLGCLYNLSYPLGYLTLPLIALAFPDWRDLQLAISLPMLILLFHCWYLPESPRWLITQGRYVRAWKIIRSIDPSLAPSIDETEAVVQGSVTSSLFERIIGGSQRFLLLFSSIELVKRIVVCWFIWFVAALVYYVLALNAVNFGTNPYIFMFLSGLVEIPAYSMPLLMLMKLGRKSTCIILFFISGSALISITGIPKSQGVLIVAVALLGRFTDVAVFGMIVVYTSELFPTTIRNTAIGSSLAISQLGSITAPYIVDNLSSYGWYIPSTISGCMSILASMVIFLLPETRGQPLLDTTDQIKQLPQSQKVSFINCCNF